MPGGKKEAQAEEKKSKKVELKVRVKNQPKIEVEPEIEEIKEIKEEKRQEKKKSVKKEKNKKEKKEQTKSVEQRGEGKIISENTEKDKKLIMWAGVIFFMVLIIGGWAYNARNVFKENEAKDSGEDVLDLQKWDDMTGELSEKIAQMKEDLKSLKEFDGEETGLGGATTTDRMLFATSSEESLSTTTMENLPVSEDAESLTEEKDEAVKNQLEELRQKLEALEKEVK